MRISLIWTKKKVIDSVLKITPKDENAQIGVMYHNCWGFLINYKGEYLIYTPFCNGHAVYLNDFISVNVEVKFHYIPSLSYLIHRIKSMR